MNQEFKPLGGQLSAALAFIEQENYSEAVYAAERELTVAPGSADAAHVLGLVAMRMDELLRAEELFSLAHKQAPNVQEHTEALSIINAKLGRLHDALFYGKLSSVLVSDGVRTALLPDWLGTFQEAVDGIEQTNFIEQGLQEHMRGDHIAAAESLRKGLQATPGNAEGWRGLRDSLMLDRRPYEALLAAQSLASFEQTSGPDLASVGEILIEIGRFAEGEGCFVTAIEENPMDLALRSRYLKSVARADLESPDEILRQEILWGGSFPKMSGATGGKNAGKHLTIGILSGSILGGGLADLIWPLFDTTVSNDVTLNVYSNNARDDGLSRRLRGKVDEWTDIGPTDDLTAATIIKNDNVDILIDLDGHKNGGRPGLAVRKPAPIVLRWCGNSVDQEESTGQAPYDGVIGDPVIYPDGKHHCAMVEGGPFSIPPEATISDPMKFPKGVPLRVGLSVARWQLSDQLLDFMEQAVKASGMIEFVLDFGALGGMSALDDIDPILEERGIYDKVTPSQPADLHSEVLIHFLNGCDVVLDPGPNANPALLWECLSRSKPVFSIPGRQPQSRISASVMLGLGMGELVDDSLETMAQHLIVLASDHDAVNALCEKIHQVVTIESATAKTTERARRLLAALVDFHHSHQTIEA